MGFVYAGLNKEYVSVWEACVYVGSNMGFVSVCGEYLC